MTPKVFRSVGRYILRTAAEYGLRDWQLVVHEGTENPEASAVVSCVYGRRIAHIGIDEGFPGWTPEEQRRVVLHELTHIHLDQVATLVQSLEPILGEQAFRTFALGYRQAMEHATDAIADAVAERYEIWEGS